MHKDIKLQKFLFIGDGLHVLNYMHKRGLNVVGAHVPDHVAHEVVSQVRIPNIYLLTTKAALIQHIGSTDFDVLVSCGHPYILPVSNLRKNHQKFVNVHSSALPSLKGPYPLCGALLKGSGAGATLHHMIDEIDSGPIISKLSIPITAELDLGLLDHIVSDMQVRVFESGMKKSFENEVREKVSVENGCYFRIEKKHLEIDLSGEVGDVIKTVNAFSSRKIGARFRFRSGVFLVFGAEFFENDYMGQMHKSAQDGEVVCIYDNNVVMKKDAGFLKLREVTTTDGSVNVGDRLICDDT